jgi:diguanylate cyclase (GGDEF)-like protein
MTAAPDSLSSMPGLNGKSQLSSRKSLLRSGGVALALACLVFVMEQTMRYVGFFDAQNQAIWWPTNGLALALMIRNDRRSWPAILAGILMGSFAGVLHYHLPISSGITNACANALGPLLAALMLPRFKNMEDWLQEPRLIFRFVLFALLLAPILSATIYALNAHLFLLRPHFWTIFRGRADSDMLGYAMFTPLVLVVSSRERYRLANISKLPRVVLLLLVVIGTTCIVFGQSAYPVSFVVVSVFVLVSLRVGFAPSVVAVNILAVLATTTTMHGDGPLAMGAGVAVWHRILLLQTFLALTMITIFSVSVIQIERTAFQKKLQLAYSEMETLATTDALTLLPNRRRFEETLNAEWARALRSGNFLSLLMIDVDHFKTYNDRFGHPAGDICLCAIANAMLSLEHRSTDLLARQGGEEFLCLLPNTPIEEAARIAETIRIRIEALEELPLGTVHAKVSVSVGCAAMVPIPGLAPSQLIAASDEALYRAKRNGRNRVEVAETPARPFAFDPVR